MPWKYILNIKLDDNVIYKRDLNENELCIQNKKIEIGDINILNCEILPNVEVTNNAR